MKNTINNTNPVRAMMKPLPVSNSDNVLKAEREACLLAFMNSNPQSICCRDVMEDLRKFPGCDEPNSMYDNTKYYRKMRAVVSTLKRLESQGRIISTLYSGRRYYSIPVGGEQ